MGIGQENEAQYLIARLDTQTFNNPSQQYKEFSAYFISENNILEYKEAFVGAKSESLRRAIYILPENKNTIPALKQTLENSGFFDLVDIFYSAIAPGREDRVANEMAASCNNPENYNDPGALATQHIEKMELPCAWSISHGCPEISVGVVDVFFANNHPDLPGFIEIKGGCDPNRNVCGHGYASAGGVAGIVNNNLCVAGAGYNTSLRGYCDGATYMGNPCGGCSVNVNEDMWPAYLDGNRVINVSCSNISNSPMFIDLVNEMTSNGVNLVVSAYGNGHSAYANIPGVINVAQLDINGNFVPYNGIETNVDIGVPILNMWRLQSPLVEDCSLGSANSSLAAPYVSGVIALMLCENPCLSPAEIENILKNTSNPIPNADDPGDPYYTQLNGAGALNAYQAVLAAQGAIPLPLTVQSGQTVTISNQTVSYSAITIEPTGTLIINNQSVVQMHKLGVITVKRGAKLIVDNSTLTTSCPKDYWGGIRVWGNNTMPQPVVYDINDNPLTQVALTADQAGVVFLLNNSRYERGNAISTHALGVDYPTMVSLRGGVVFAKNTEFVDNRRVAEFTQYPPPSAGYTFQNTSKFIDCLFTEESGEVDGSIGVTIWDTDGITFERCTFSNLDWEGILTYDAGAIIKDGNNFLDNWRAITNTATYPFGAWLEVGDKNGELIPNYFESPNRDFIYSSASNKWGGLKVYHNEFFGGKGGIGIWIDGPSQFQVDNNSFEGLSGAMTVVNSGAKNEWKQNFIRCNAIQNTVWGIDFYGENRHAQFLGNQFQSVESDMLLRGDASIKGRIRTNQGGPGSPASNCFDSPLGGDIITESSATTESFRYWTPGETSQPCLIPTTPGNYTISYTFGDLTDCSKLPGAIDNPTEEDLDNIRQQIVSLEGQLQQDPNNQTLEAQWLDALYQKELLLGGLVRERMEAGDYAGAEALLAQENTVEADYSLFGLKMDRGAYTEAQAFLNTLPQTTQDETWFVQVQQINIQRLQNEETFQLSAQQESLLNQVADSESPVRSYARAILMLLKDKHYESEHPLVERSAQPTGKVEPDAEPATKWTVAPNPANHSVRIDFGRETSEDAVLTLTDIHGRIMLQLDIPKVIIATIETGGLPEGIYMAVLKENGKPSGQSRIAIQH